MIAEQRKEYISRLEGFIGPVVSAFSGLGLVSLEYSQGWPEDRSILDVLLADEIGILQLVQPPMALSVQIFGFLLMGWQQLIVCREGSPNY